MDLAPYLARRTALLFGLLSIVIPLVPASAQPFTFYFQRNDLEGIQFGNALWGDYDNDGDLDVLLIGASGNESIATLYRFDGLEERRVILETHTYASYDIVQHFDAGGFFGNGAWGDYDNDGDLDVVVMGARNQEDPYLPVTQIYLNDNGHFVEQNLNLPGVLSGSASWGDYDNDGDLDLLLTGAVDFNSSIYLADIFRNDGDRFEAVGAGFPGTLSGSSAWGDFDSDGDLDVLLTGSSREQFISQIYRNNGTSFQNIDAGLRGLMFSTGSWGDYDSDGDLDILITGAQLGPAVMNGHTIVYENRNGTFTNLELGLRGVFYGSGSWGDYDNDGSLDIMLMGNDQPLGQRVGRIYRREGNGFTYASNLPGIFLGNLSLGDYDGDADLDLLTIGTDQEFHPRTTLYSNEQRTVNERPLPPTGLSSSTRPGRVTLRWRNTVDTETPADGLTYNVRVGTTPGGSEILSAMADPDNGRRLVTAMGNVGHNTEWKLSHLGVGTYYWSVQALDHSFAASSFAEEGSFEVSSTGNISTGTSDRDGLIERVSLSQNYPNPFNRLTTIEYALPQPSNVTLTVYNVLGETVRVLVQGTQAAGRKNTHWDGTDGTERRVSPGVYFYRLSVGDRIISKKLLLVH